MDNEVEEDGEQEKKVEEKKRRTRRSINLKDGEQWLPERIKVAARFVDERVEVEPAAEQLHAEQGEDDDEEKEQEQERHYGAHRVEQGGNEVTQSRPVPRKNKLKYIYNITQRQS